MPVLYGKRTSGSYPRTSRIQRLPTRLDPTGGFPGNTDYRHLHSTNYVVPVFSLWLTLMESQCETSCFLMHALMQITDPSPLQSVTREEGAWPYVQNSDLR